MIAEADGRRPAILTVAVLRPARRTRFPGLACLLGLPWLGFLAFGGGWLVRAGSAIAATAFAARPFSLFARAGLARPGLVRSALARARFPRCGLVGVLGPARPALRPLLLLRWRRGRCLRGVRLGDRHEWLLDVGCAIAVDGCGRLVTTLRAWRPAGAPRTVLAGTSLARRA